MSSIDPGSLTPLKVLTSPSHNIQYTPLKSPSLKTPPLKVSLIRRLSSPLGLPMNSPPDRCSLMTPTLGVELNGVISPVKSHMEVADGRKVCITMVMFFLVLFVLHNVSY